MNRVVMLGIALTLSIRHGLIALPSHVAEAELRLIDGKPEASLGYGIRGIGTYDLSVSIRLAEQLQATFKAGTTEGGVLLYGGRGSAVNAIALRSGYQSYAIAGNPLPWASSSLAGSIFGLGLRSGIFDFLMLMDSEECSVATKRQILNEPSAAAIQLSATGRNFMGGCALSAVRLKHESIGDDGWAETAIPSSGGYFSTISASGRVSRERAYFETWACLGAGMLEPPGAALSIAGGCEFFTSPNMRFRAGMFVSSGRYRNWLGKASECDMLFTGNFQSDWEKCKLRVDGNLMSGDAKGLPGPFTEGSFIFSAELPNIKVKGEVMLDTEGLNSAEGSLRYEVGLFPNSRLGLSLAARTDGFQTFRGGVSFAWKPLSTAHSSGKAVFQMSYEDVPDKQRLVASGSLVQDFSLFGWCFASIELRSPEGGYVLGSRNIPLPDGRINLSLVFPPP